MVRRHSASAAPLLATFLLLASYILPAHALYFYIDGTTPKCFFEELPKDTIVVGHYRAEEFDIATNKYELHDALTINVDVYELFGAEHHVIAQRGSSTGRFTFSAADSGDHKLCFTPASTHASGWLSAGNPTAGVKLTLDMVVGETSKIESTDKGKLLGIADKVKELNARLQNIRREQVFQREREAEFRNQSESTNARVVRWTLMQLAVLGVTCAWQLSHLRAFFIKQKLT